MKSEKHIKDETNKNKIQKNLVNLKDIEKFAMEYDEKLEKRKQEREKTAETPETAETAADPEAEV